MTLVLPRLTIAQAGPSCRFAAASDQDHRHHRPGQQAAEQHDRGQIAVPPAGARAAQALTPEANCGAPLAAIASLDSTKARRTKKPISTRRLGDYATMQGRRHPAPAPPRRAAVADEPSAPSHRPAQQRKDRPCRFVHPCGAPVRAPSRFTPMRPPANQRDPEDIECQPHPASLPVVAMAFGLRKGAAAVRVDMAGFPRSARRPPPLPALAVAASNAAIWRRARSISARRGESGVGDGDLANGWISVLAGEGPKSPGLHEHPRPAPSPSSSATTGRCRDAVACTNECRPARARPQPGNDRSAHVHRTPRAAGQLLARSLRRCPRSTKRSPFFRARAPISAGVNDAFRRLHHPAALWRVPGSRPRRCSRAASAADPSGHQSPTWAASIPPPARMAIDGRQVILGPGVSSPLNSERSMRPRLP